MGGFRGSINLLASHTPIPLVAVAVCLPMTGLPFGTAFPKTIGSQWFLGTGLIGFGNALDLAMPALFFGGLVRRHMGIHHRLLLPPPHHRDHDEPRTVAPPGGCHPRQLLGLRVLLDGLAKSPCDPYAHLRFPLIVVTVVVGGEEEEVRWWWW